QRAVTQLGVDLHLVLARAQRRALLVAQAEPPILLVVAGPVGNERGPSRKPVQVPLQVLEGYLSPEGLAVVEHVQVEALGIQDQFASGCAQPRGPERPFLRDYPVEDARAGRHFAQLERHHALEDLQRTSQALPRDAAADRVDLTDELV